MRAGARTWRAALIRTRTSACLSIGADPVDGLDAAGGVKFRCVRIGADPPYSYRRRARGAELDPMGDTHGSGEVCICDG